MVVFEVKGEALGTYFMQFGQILSFSSDHNVGEWKFDIMLCRQAFDTIPRMLDIEGRMLPVIVLGRRPACWKCGQMYYMATLCRRWPAMDCQPASDKSTPEILNVPLKKTSVHATPLPTVGEGD